MPTAEQFLKMVFPNGMPSTTRNFEYSCRKCNDTGHIIISKFPLIVEDCECEKRRRLERRINNSGLAETMKRCTFGSFDTAEKWQETVRNKALEYLNSAKSAWFFISGTPGSGKTHICTAICGEFIKCGVDTRYVKWREAAPRLKALVKFPEEYAEELDKLKTCELLYIDDFLKGNVTDADINLSYELLNYRYCERLRTVISGERSIEEIISIDEATGSRIFELAKGFVIAMPKGKNRRLSNE